MLWAKIQNQNGTFVALFGENADSELSKFRTRDEGSLRMILGDVDMSFSTSKTPTLDGNRGTIMIAGLDAAQRATLIDTGSFFEGIPEVSKFIYRFDESSKRYTKPPLAGASDVSLEQRTVRYRTIGWSILTVYWRDRRIYSGDITDIETTEDTITISASTGEFLLNMPVSLRVIKGSDSSSSLEIMRKTANAADPVTTLGLVAQTYPYARTCKLFIDDWVRRDPFDSSTLTMQKTLDTSSDLYVEALKKLVKEGDLNITDIKVINDGWVDDPKKPNKKNKKGKPPAVGYYLIQGSFKEVLQKAVDAGLILVWCNDNDWYIWSRFLPMNGPVSSRVVFGTTDSLESPGINIKSLLAYNENLYPLAGRRMSETRTGRFLPGTGPERRFDGVAGSFNVSGDRFSFTMAESGIKLNLDLWHTVLVNEVEYLVDTIAIQADQESILLTYSGRTRGWTRL